MQFEDAVTMLRAQVDAHAVSPYLLRALDVVLAHVESELAHAAPVVPVVASVTVRTTDEPRKDDAAIVALHSWPIVALSGRWRLLDEASADVLVGTFAETDVGRVVFVTSEGLHMYHVPAGYYFRRVES